MFVRHSSFNDSTQSTLQISNSFASLQDLSAIIQEKEFESYTEIAKTENKKIFNRIINYHLPISRMVASTRNVYYSLNCSDVRHFAHIDYRDCCFKEICPTTYKIIKCNNLNIIRIFQKISHNHPLIELGYNNLVGIDDYFKIKINDYLAKNITAPKRIQGDLTVLYRNIRLDDNDNQVDYVNGNGDLIPIPNYEQVKSYVNTNKKSFCYPLSYVFGRTDIVRKFHPIALMLTSHEQIIDYQFFYSTMAEITKSLNIEFEMKYIMQDASKAESTACLSIFPSAIIIMCYFHVKSNCEKNMLKYEVPLEYREQVLKDISFIHYSTSISEYNSRVSIILYKWSGYRLNIFIDYFKKQWLSYPFNNCQIFNTPPGYATTNTCESFNKRIKEDYTINKKRHILDCFMIMEKMIINYSTNAHTFKLYPCSLNHDKAVLDKASRLNANNFMQITINIIRFDSINKTTGLTSSRRIQIFPYYCDCITFLDLAYCHHLLAINRLGLLKISIDPTYKAPEPPRRLVTRNSRRAVGRGKKIKGSALKMI